MYTVNIRKFPVLPILNFVVLLYQKLLEHSFLALTLL